MLSNIRGIVPNNKPNNNITDDDINDKAEEFNTYFANIGRKTFERCKNDFTNNNTNSDNVRVTHDTTDIFDTNNFFRPKPVDVETVILTISKLKQTKAVGSDGISLNFIKDSLFVTAFYLFIFFFFTSKPISACRHDCLFDVVLRQARWWRGQGFL